MSQTSLVPVSPELLFRGRPGDPRLGEWVKTDTNIPLQKVIDKEALVIIGFPDDEGVTRNRGRGGAKNGPDGTRKHFYKLCPPMDFEWEKKIELYDNGNINIGGSIDITHANAQGAAEQIARTGATLITIGGGHDFAAPAFMGFKAGQATLHRKERDLALINIDPHLDLRPLEHNLPHSGTPFRVILEAKATKNLTAFGIRQNRNARAHYQYAVDNGVDIFTLDKIRSARKTAPALFESEVKRLAKGTDALGVTIDMDSCFEAEGTSAAPVIGFSAQELCEMAFVAGQEKKVKWFDLSEAAPNLDGSERICRIASEIIFHFLWGRARSLVKKRG